MSNLEIDSKHIKNEFIKGFTFGFLPLIVVGLTSSTFEALPERDQVLISFLILLSFLYGYIFCWQFAHKYAQYKGYSNYFGLVGIFNFWGLAFLFILNNKNHKIDPIGSENNYFCNFSFVSI